MTNTKPSPDERPPSTDWRVKTPVERLERAQEYLRGTQATFEVLRDLAGAMKDIDKRFTHARRLLLARLTPA